MNVNVLGIYVSHLVFQGPAVGGRCLLVDPVEGVLAGDDEYNKG